MDSESLVAEVESRFGESSIRPASRGRPRLRREGKTRRRSGHGYADRPARLARAEAASSKRASLQPVDASDETLLTRMLRGDATAGDTLVGRYYSPLMGYLQRIAGAQAAEDLHQQTWLSALAHAGRFVASAGAGSFRGWLFRIAANKTKDHWRSTGRETVAKAGYGRMTLDEEFPWAGHAADGAEQVDRLCRAIQDLPEGQREVLLLRYYSNMKFTDIAAVLGCPLNTALTRSHKALLKLREALAREPEGAARE